MNEEVKNEFYESIKSRGSRIRCKSILNRMMPWEDKHGRDCATITLDEMKEYVANDLTDIYSYVSLLSFMTFFRRYVVYYYRLFKDFSPELILTTDVEEFDISKGMRENLFGNEEDLELFIETFDAGNGDIASPMSVLLWMGFSTSEMADIRDHDIVPVKDDVVMVARRVCVNPVFCKALLDYKKASIKHTGLSPIVTTEAVDTGQYLKMFAFKKYLHERSSDLTSSDITRMYNAGCKTPRIKQTLLSGALYRMWQLERSGREVSDDDIVRETGRNALNNWEMRGMRQTFDRYKRTFWA